MEEEVEAINLPREVWALLRSECLRAWREGIAAMDLAGRFRTDLMKTFESGRREGIEAEGAKVLKLFDEMNTESGGLGLDSIQLTRLRGLISATTLPPQEELDTD